ncbi:MAG: MBL fold metallo-hydrolase, partial [Pseudomonadota bacterium]|nr:MBL fold metallo-hydrolase [Pseudomonadota bacterium]
MSNIQPVPGVWQLTRLSDFSCHLVEGQDDCTLIDTNFGGSAPAVLRLAEKLKKPIKRILITHAHTDHIGSLDAVVAALPQVEIYATQRTSEFMAGDR